MPEDWPIVYTVLVAVVVGVLVGALIIAVLCICCEKRPFSSRSSSSARYARRHYDYSHYEPSVWSAAPSVVSRGGYEDTGGTGAAPPSHYSHYDRAMPGLGMQDKPVSMYGGGQSYPPRPVSPSQQYYYQDKAPRYTPEKSGQYYYQQFPYHTMDSRPQKAMNNQTADKANYFTLDTHRGSGGMGPPAHRTPYGYVDGTDVYYTGGGDDELLDDLGGPAGGGTPYPSKTL